MLLKPKYGTSDLLKPKLPNPGLNQNINTGTKAMIR